MTQPSFRTLPRAIRAFTEFFRLEAAGGIVLILAAALALGWARYPEGMDHRAMLGLGFLCGIGFTMSLFIASLAYLDPVLYDEAVLGIFVASVVAALLGLGWLRVVLPARPAAP